MGGYLSKFLLFIGIQLGTQNLSKYSVLTHVNPSPLILKSLGEGLQRQVKINQ
jgi:hypothetical protein